MAIPVHAGRRTPYPSSIRHNPWGYTRQRPRVNLGSEESNLTYSSNMAQVAGPNSQFVTQVQDISGSHVPQPAPQLNPFRFAYSQADYYSPDPNAGVQQPWTSASAAPIYPIYHDPPCAVDSTASFQPPEALPEATQNQTVPSTSYYPYNDSPLHYFPDVDNPMPLHVSIATSSLQFAIPVQQATPDTLPVNVDSMTAFF